MAEKEKRESVQSEEIRVVHPSYSRKAEPEEEPKKVEKIITTNVIQRKKSFGKKLAESFVGDDSKNIFEYIVYVVLVPAAKNAIEDMVTGGIKMLLFGENSRSNDYIRRDKGRSYVSYDRMNYGGRNDNVRSNRNVDVGRSRHNFDDIILTTRGEAEEVLSHLVELCLTYGVASVSDLYDLVGVPSAFTDNKWGWTNLSSADTVRVRDGYLLNLPRPVQID